MIDWGAIDPGEALTPRPDGSRLRWLSRRGLTGGASASYKGPMVIKDGHQRVSVDLPIALVADLNALTAADGLTRQDRLRMMIQMGAADPGLQERVRAALISERHNAAPRIDPRRGPRDVSS